jgi:hypothetical protein
MMPAYWGGLAFLAGVFVGLLCLPGLWRQDAADREAWRKAHEMAWWTPRGQEKGK